MQVSNTHHVFSEHPEPIGKATAQAHDLVLAVGAIVNGLKVSIVPLGPLQLVGIDWGAPICWGAPSDQDSRGTVCCAFQRVRLFRHRGLSGERCFFTPL